MPNAINIGLDLGSTCWRAAYLQNERIVPLRLFEGDDHTAHFLRCEASQQSALPIHFPSIKSLVGSDNYIPLGTNAAPEEVIQSWLAALVRAVEQRASGVPGQLVIAVPALYSAIRRATVRDLALEAGFAEVHLLNDSMAAVVGHMRSADDSAALMLVFGMGYSGFEAGLIRIARGRYRAIAYDGSPWIGGARFDMMIMRGCLQLLVSQQMWSPSHTLSADTWLRFRQIAQGLKESLSENETTSLRLNLTGESVAPPPLQLSRAEFAQGVAAACEPAFDAVAQMLEEAKIRPADIDAVLLSGGSMAIKSVRQSLEAGFDRPMEVLGPDAIANGAAVYASQLRLIPASDAPLVGPVEPVQTEDTGAVLPVLKVTLSSTEAEQEASTPLAQFDSFETSQQSLHSADTFELLLDINLSSQPSVPPSPTSPTSTGDIGSLNEDRQRLFQEIRALAEKGAPDAARALLHGIVQDSHAMLDSLAEIAVPAAPTGIPPHIQLVLDRANEYLAAGRFQQAVEQSHIALRMDEKNSDVFEQLIAVHVDAAMAHSSFEGYDKAIQWLKCALNHDQTNSTVKNLIADRQFEHAKVLIDAGDTNHGKNVLDESLSFNPFHEEAEELHASLVAAEVEIPRE